jgi:hypothetical protein
MRQWLLLQTLLCLYRKRALGSLTLRREHQQPLVSLPSPLLLERTPMQAGYRAAVLQAT